jgi:putative DNA methylase
VSTFILSGKKGKETYVDPIVEGDKYSFKVKIGTPTESAKNGTVSRKGAFCLFSNAPIDFKYLRAEAKAGRFGRRLMAVVAEGVKGRIYLSPPAAHEIYAESIEAERFTEAPICHWPGRTNVVEYGMTKFLDLFTSRQLLALTSFSDLVQETVEIVHKDALSAGMPDDGLSLDNGGRGALAYAQAIGVYLAMATSRWTDLSNNICGWNNINQNVRALFSRQAIPMTWDYVELSPFGSVGPWYSAVESIVNASENLAPYFPGSAFQADAQNQKISSNKVVSTDPPYYDNIGYADLSDFFYIWLRRSLKSIFPNIYATVAVPKAEELVATPYRHGNKGKAEEFFLDGMTEAMQNLAKETHAAFPVTIYYAFKQAETKGDAGTSSTGWETFLAAVLSAGFSITGTWPMRTERDARSIGIGSNALASSIVLVCRKRATDASTISRREFIRELNLTLPDALSEMTRGGINSPVAPVDLSQAIIGPGMEVFSKYSAVTEANGNPMSVRTALQLINRFIGEDDFDHDTQFCLAWFEQHGWAEGKYGEADVLARAKGTSVGGLTEAGVVESSAGNLRLLKWAEMPRDWSPENDNRVPIWEALHQLIRALNQDGETAAGALLARMPDKTANLNALMYRLYILCERQGWAEEARAYNELQGAWVGIEQASQEVGHIGSQSQMDI